MPTSTSIVPTATPVATVTICPLPFTDVDVYNPFYVYIRCLYCRGIVSGYADNTFRPFTNITRGQVAKIVTLAAGYTDAVPSTQQSFTDVPYSSAFWIYIERAALHNVISGYNTPASCSTGVPCFLPYNNVTRGQLAKMDSQAAGYADAVPSTAQSFTDVPYSNPFWLYIERLARRGIINGYACGLPPAGACDSLNRPWFLPFTDVTRGQASKIVANTFFPVNCAPGPQAQPRP
ncbi:MAG TPA: S-layer homology domain-containing protein [Chloroflexia bacterium]|nr:S-layer homology domain-containing protein [Chloroflexia bacterium]